MASIRRTLSPAAYHDHRSFKASSYSPSSNNSSSSNKKPFLLRRLLILMSTFSLHNHKPSRKLSNLKRSLLRFFVCFLLGFFLGLAPSFIDLDDTDLRRGPHHPFFFDSDFSQSQSHPNVIRPGAAIEILKSEDPVSVELEAKPRREEEDLPKLLIVVTPTYNRALQAYYLTRLGQTLRLVPPPLLWIVVEMKSASMETAQILRSTGVTYRHLVSLQNLRDVKDRGVHQRNTALDHIHRHHLDGIVYFADDDNIYSRHLFHRLREIRRFGTWPVAMLAQSKNKATVEGPICNGSQVIGWHTNEKSKRLRRFHVDMSGFAFNSTILWSPKSWHRPTSDPIRQLDTVKEGFQETTFIEQVVEDESQMEGLPHDCSKIMNWHLHLEARHLFYPRGWQLSRNLDVMSSLR